MDKEAILKGLSAYDRPSHSDLPHIGVIEFIWKQIVDCLYIEDCPTWKARIQELETTILKRCPDNFYREQAIVYLQQLEKYILESDFKQVAILLENTKDWARKSIIRKGNNARV